MSLRRGLLRACRACAACALLIVIGFSSIATAQNLPSDAEIRAMLVNKIDVERQSIGIVVGVIEPAGRRIIAYGSPAAGMSDKRPLDGNTIFEIGSITKVFTSLLLEDMVLRKQMKLNDPVTKYLPPGVRAPMRGGRTITLVDLATHTSGLPRMPTNFTPRDGENPYADYTVEKLNRFLSTFQLTRDIGTEYEYSNVGAGLLGRAIAQRANSDYETLVVTRICDPLGMNSTRITLMPEMLERLAIGHDLGMGAVPNWDMPTIAGAGALRSSANDLLELLAVALGYKETPLSKAMAVMLTVRRPTNDPNMEVALAWHTIKREGAPIFWHNGETGGYRSYIAFDPAARTGVVALSNMNTAVGVDDIGQHLITH